jgi:hypothetical protein
MTLRWWASRGDTSIEMGPDRRFGNNRKLPICLYAEIDLKSSSGLNDRINCSRSNGAEEFGWFS